MIDLAIKLEDPNGMMPRFREIARDFPKVVETAQLRAVRNFAVKIRSGVSKMDIAYVGKLPGLAPLTQAVHGKKPGGVLATNKNLCKVMNINGHLAAGYITSVDGVFGRWQEGGLIDLTSPKRRSFLHMQLRRAGAPDLEIPQAVVQPERMVVEPIARKFGPELPGWILSMIDKLLDKKLARAQGK
jgi:hypothetical protein